MEDERLAALERIARGAVVMTTRALGSAAPGVDVTLPQWRLPIILGDEPAGVRLGDVARRVGVTLPATSRLLDRLARRGLVTFETDARDRRARRAMLTDQGREVREAILEHRRGALRGVAATVGRADPSDRRSGEPSLLDRLLEAVAAEFDRFA